VIWENATDELNTVDLSISLNAIDVIYLNPWLAPTLVDATKATLKSIPGCSSIRIFRSTLVGNKRWKEAVSNAVENMPDK
jgi:hypothetical protein